MAQATETTTYTQTLPEDTQEMINYVYGNLTGRNQNTVDYIRYISNPWVAKDMFFNVDLESGELTYREPLELMTRKEIQEALSDLPDDSQIKKWWLLKAENFEKTLGLSPDDSILDVVENSTWLKSIEKAMEDGGVPTRPWNMGYNKDAWYTAYEDPLNPNADYTGPGLAKNQGKQTVEYSQPTLDILESDLYDTTYDEMFGAPAKPYDERIADINKQLNENIPAMNPFGYETGTPNETMTAPQNIEQELLPEAKPVSENVSNNTSTDGMPNDMTGYEQLLTNVNEDIRGKGQEYADVLAQTGEEKIGSSTSAVDAYNKAISRMLNTPEKQISLNFGGMPISFTPRYEQNRWGMASDMLRNQMMSKLGLSDLISNTRQAPSALLYDMEQKFPESNPALKAFQDLMSMAVTREARVPWNMTTTTTLPDIQQSGTNWLDTIKSALGVVQNGVNAGSDLFSLISKWGA